MQIVLFCFRVRVQLVVFVLLWILLVSLKCYVLIYLRWLLCSCRHVCYFMGASTMEKRWFLSLPLSGRCHIVKVQLGWTRIIYCHIWISSRAFFKVLVVDQREVSNWDYVPEKELWNENSCVLYVHFVMPKISSKYGPFLIETQPENNCSSSECDHERCQMQLNPI